VIVRERKVFLLFPAAERFKCGALSRTERQKALRRLFSGNFWREGSTLSERKQTFQWKRVESSRSFFLSQSMREFDGKIKNLVAVHGNESSLLDSFPFMSRLSPLPPTTPTNYHNLFIHFFSTKHNRLLSQRFERGSSERER
jgi:hypothetical protein